MLGTSYCGLFHLSSKVFERGFSSSLGRECTKEETKLTMCPVIGDRGGSLRLDSQLRIPRGDLTRLFSPPSYMILDCCL